MKIKNIPLKKEDVLHAALRTQVKQLQIELGKIKEHEKQLQAEMERLKQNLLDFGRLSEKFFKDKIA